MVFTRKIRTSAYWNTKTGDYARANSNSRFRDIRLRNKIQEAFETNEIELVDSTLRACLVGVFWRGEVSLVGGVRKDEKEFEIGVFWRGRAIQQKKI